MTNEEYFKQKLSECSRTYYDSEYEDDMIRLFKSIARSLAIIADSLEKKNAPPL